MPQLMPLLWDLSMFMSLFIMIIMVIFYFTKLLEFDLIVSDNFNGMKFNKYLFENYMW